MDRRLPLVAYADGAGSAVTPPGAVAGADARVVLGWSPDPRPWFDTATGDTLMAGYALAGAVAAGRLQHVPTRLSAAAHTVERMTPDVVVVAVVPRGSGFAFGPSVGWAPAALDLARRTGARRVLEVDDAGVDLGGPDVDPDGARVLRAARPAVAPPRPVPTAADLRLAEHVVALLPDGATLQFGPGAVGDAVVRTVDRPVGVWSGLVSDAVADLAARGLLREPAVAAYLHGGDAVVDLARAGGVRLAPVAVTHDPAGIAVLPRFVACNTALQVGLDGAVNVERVAGRWVAGRGGHPDFCAAAARSPSGLSVVALRSTHGHRSTIVPRVELVSTPGTDVDVVVTEHGVADLRGSTASERAAALVQVAAPEHRRALAAASVR